MNKPVIFLDFDGVLSKPYKLWEIGVQGLHVQKLISDHDSCLIDMVKNRIDFVIISNDHRVNSAWADRKGVPFICPDPKLGGKFDYLAQYWARVYGGDADAEYIYIGDAMPDLQCMITSKMAFYPKDASLILKRHCKLYSHITELGTKGGEGCVESAFEMLREAGLLPKDIL